jgi:serine/threonine-protein phosphatase 2A regulatory subunit A
MKQSVIEQFPVLARQLGESFFNEKLSPICFEWMKDNIFTIREAAIDNMKQLTIIFGESWAQTHILGLLL